MELGKLLVIALGLLTLSFGLVLYNNMTDSPATANRPITDSEVRTMEIHSASGSPFIIHQAGPESSDAAILVVHDWFGISPFSVETIERLGALGYYAVAIDLYGGESAEDHQRAWDLMSALDPDDVISKLNGAIDHIDRPGRKIATMGFSMGSAFALEANLHNPDRVDATVLIYGDMERDPERLQVLDSPVLAITGSRDNPGQLTDFLTQMESVEKSAEIYIYPGALHAYSQPLFNNGDNYDETATRLTWMLTEDFLARHLR